MDVHVIAVYPPCSRTLQRKSRGRTRGRKRPRWDDESPVKRRRVERAEGRDVCSAILAPTSPSTVLAPASPVGCSSPARLSSARVSSSPQPSRPTSDVPTSDAPTSDAPTSDAPTSDAPTSDVPTRSSPPSSPALASSPPADARRRPVFSLFRRNLKHSVSAPAALSERNRDTHRTPPPPPPPKKKRMVQMQLDLASQHRKACRTCGMEYIPSNAADVALHNKFHATNRGGVDCTKATAARLRQKQVWSGDGGFVAVVGRRDATALRNKASEVLRVVNAELAAVPVADGELWSQTTRAEGAALSKCDRFKVYLYVRGQKCVAACLAESIREAFTVLAQGDVSGAASGNTSGNASGNASGTASGNASGTASGNASGTASGNASGNASATASEQQPSQSSSISVSTAADTVLLGISRIWVSSQFRKQGLARRLLDVARGDFTYGLTVDKRLTAFSQPTESGGKLARSYFGCEAGWHVYMD
ncbi:sister chromatid cohesion acetyltransferas-like protein Eco1 [Boeremia exigua]|uniref:sister chromatid cohesion acetyltransferase-like protein Eco1 n=1 Tax=Boeremia exigua TaxID=749465 RepID=UPI001E8E90E7|nr:sister chromatid cohesion acetyltransferase-like protein Eco1 [Boeremia exigua]KAH6637722.1 sister chromatid cohesion acetyltransferas-like protein Eco1 [Boeremia exigua]